MDPILFGAILADIAAGEATHKAVAAQSVPRKAFYAYLATNEDAGNRYARAKLAGLKVLADEIIEIADDGAMDRYRDEDGADRVDQEVIGRARLRVDSRKWLLSKLAPKKYGDRVDLTHAGPDGGPVVVKLDSADGRL